MPAVPRDVFLPDGRTIDVLVGGAAAGPALVLHHGTPLDASAWLDWDAQAQAAGFQLIAPSRPGYAGSTRQAGRSVASIAADVDAILAQRAAPWFVTAGWSGGGPHALACAALLPACRAATTLAGVGPYGEPELDFLAGMGPENVAEFGAALQSEAVLRDWMARNAEPSRVVTGPELIATFGGLVSQADKDVLVGGFADRMAASMRRGLAAGVDGWVDDDLAFAQPWGFDLAAIRVSVTVWQGDQDLMVPFAHGRWLATHVPGARAQLISGHGHISLVTTYREEIVRDLVARGAVTAS